MNEEHSHEDVKVTLFGLVMEFTQQADALQSRLCCSPGTTPAEQVLYRLFEIEATVSDARGLVEDALAHAGGDAERVYEQWLNGPVADEEVQVPVS